MPHADGHGQGPSLGHAAPTMQTMSDYYWARQKLLLSRGQNVTESNAKKRLVLPRDSVTFWVRQGNIRTTRAVNQSYACGWVRGDDRWSMARQMVSHFQTSTRVGRAEYSTLLGTVLSLICSSTQLALPASSSWPARAVDQTQMTAQSISIDYLHSDSWILFIRHIIDIWLMYVNRKWKIKSIKVSDVFKH